MLNSKWGAAIVTVIAFAVVGAILTFVFTRFVGFLPSRTIPPAAPPAAPPVGSTPQGAVVPRFNPPRPEDAPADIRDAVMLGYNILMDPQTHAGQYVGNKLACKSCHFDAGLGNGDRNGGISLVGVGATYPKYRDRQKFAVDLVARVND